MTSGWDPLFVVIKPRFHPFSTSTQFHRQVPTCSFDYLQVTLAAFFVHTINTASTAFGLRRRTFYDTLRILRFDYFRVTLADGFQRGGAGLEMDCCGAKGDSGFISAGLVGSCSWFGARVSICMGH